MALGARIVEVQDVFQKIYNLPKHFLPNGKQFDRLLENNETLLAGSIKIRVFSTPGHTPACVCYLIDDSLFTGDALFLPDE